MKIYLDNCCFNRLFDDQSNYRIHLEAEAIKTILNLCEHSQSGWEIVVSEVTLFEIGNMPGEDTRKRLELLITIARRSVSLTNNIERRAKEFEEHGIKAFDALHLASAEHEADIFLTVDDKFLKKAQLFKSLQIRVYNPLKWIEEVL